MIICRSSPMEFFQFLFWVKRFSQWVIAVNAASQNGESTVEVVDEAEKKCLFSEFGTGLEAESRYEPESVWKFGIVPENKSVRSVFFRALFMESQAFKFSLKFSRGLEGEEEENVSLMEFWFFSSSKFGVEESVE